MNRLLLLMVILLITASFALNQYAFLLMEGHLRRLTIRVEDRLDDHIHFVDERLDKQDQRIHDALKPRNNDLQILEW